MWKWPLSSTFGWTFYGPGMLNESTHWNGRILCLGQHSGLPSTQPNRVWWIQSEEDTGNGGGVGVNWGTDFARLSHMAKHAQRGQLSLNKHNHFLLAAHKAFKQKPVRRSSQGHLGERTASHQNTAGSLWLSICRHPKKTQTWPCSSTSPHTPKIPLQQTRLPYKEYIWPFACRQKLRQVSVTERKALASTKLLSFTILNKGCIYISTTSVIDW